MNVIKQIQLIQFLSSLCISILEQIITLTLEKFSLFLLCLQPCYVLSADKMEILLKVLKDLRCLGNVGLFCREKRCIMGKPKLHTLVSFILL